MSERIFVALGSNLGNRQAFIQEALRLVEQLPGTRVRAVAKLRETEALLPSDDSTPQPKYLNTVAELSSELEPLELLRELKRIEQQLGRVSATRWAPRTIDLDVVLYGVRVISMAELTVPHPGFRMREFVLRPLLELFPEARDPRTGERLDDAPIECAP